MYVFDMEISNTSRNVDSTLSNETDYLLPWYLNYLGGNWSEATQCMVAGSNGYDANHLALNGDLNNHWATENTPWSWGYFKREELPVHFAMAEGYTVNDMYQEGQITATNPNRVTWVSGSINATGAAYIDNNETPGTLYSFSLFSKSRTEKGSRLIQAVKQELLEHIPAIPSHGRRPLRSMNASMCHGKFGKTLITLTTTQMPGSSSTKMLPLAPRYTSTVTLSSTLSMTSLRPLRPALFPK